MSLRVGVDIDGVLADFRRAFRVTAQQVSGRAMQETSDLEVETMTASRVRRVWDAIARTPQWWLTLEPYEPEEIERLYRTGREKRWEIYFITTRPPSAGETQQFQSQWWLERHGFHLPAVVTVPGSRGELANALRLDVHIDDRWLNCVEVMAASRAKAIYLLRDNDVAARERALQSGIAVVSTLREAINAVEQLEAAMRAKRSPLTRLADWFRSEPPDDRLPLNVREHLPLKDE